MSASGFIPVIKTRSKGILRDNTGGLYHPRTFMPLPRDIQDFLDGYPRVKDDANLSANLDFYSNNLRCQPDNLLVVEIHDRYVAWLICTRFTLNRACESSRLDGWGVTKSLNINMVSFNGCMFLPILAVIVFDHYPR
jgi:hypothetical protein